MGSMLPYIAASESPDFQRRHELFGEISQGPPSVAFETTGDLSWFVTYVPMILVHFLNNWWLNHVKSLLNTEIVRSSINQTGVSRKQPLLIFVLMSHIVPSFLPPSWPGHIDVPVIMEHAAQSAVATSHVQNLRIQAILQGVENIPRSPWQIPGKIYGQWIGLRENLQETHGFLPSNWLGFPVYFPIIQFYDTGSLWEIYENLWETYGTF